MQDPNEIHGLKTRDSRFEHMIIVSATVESALRHGHWFNPHSNAHSHLNLIIKNYLGILF